MSDETTVPIGQSADETPTEVMAPAAPPAPQAPQAHTAHGWLSWLIIALGVLAAVAAIVIGVRFFFGMHHFAGMWAVRHGFVRGALLRRGPLGMRGGFGIRGWRR